MSGQMTRRKSRELAFILLFEMSFTGETLEELLETSGEILSDIMENAADARQGVTDQFALFLAGGVMEHLTEIDALIQSGADHWNIDRISRVSLAILRLAVFEMNWVDEISVSISINEAVELAKLYGGDADSQFVNGLLGGIARRTSSNE